MRYYTNSAPIATVTNAGGISDVSTLLILSTSQGFPTNFPFTLRIEPNTANEELVTVMNGSGTSQSPYTITRGSDNTTARVHAQTAAVQHAVSARDLQEPQEHISNTGAVHGPPFARRVRFVIPNNIDQGVTGPNTWADVTGAYLDFNKRYTNSRLIGTIYITGYSIVTPCSGHFGLKFAGAVPDLLRGVCYWQNFGVTDRKCWVGGEEYAAGFAPGIYRFQASIQVDVGHFVMTANGDMVTITVEEIQNP